MDFNPRTADWDKIIAKASEYKDRIVNYKPYSDKEIKKAVRDMVVHVGVSVHKPKIVWMADLKPKDLEPKDNARFTIRDDFTRWQGAGYRLTGILRSIDYAIHAELFGWNTPDEIKALVPQELKEIYDTTPHYNRWDNRITRMVNQARLISSRMYNLKSKIDLKPDWVPYNYYARSVLPLELQAFPKAFSLGEEFDTRRPKTTAKLMEACQIIAASLYSLLFINDKIILIERPKIYIEERETQNGTMATMIHREDGPAIEFTRLKAGIYVLNNVRVFKPVVMKKAEELKAEMLTKTRNAEVRREVIRKIGMDRVLEELSQEVLDKDGDYELINLSLGDGRSRPYLKMLNPSTGTWHIEGVRPGIRTVDQALEYRNGIPMRPIIIT